MNQSNYSKVERGLRRLSFGELQYLCKTEVDVHYVFTARRSNAQYIDCFRGYRYEELISALGILYHSVRKIMGTNNRENGQESLLDLLHYVPLIANEQKNENIFYALRQSLDLSQIAMSDKLGLDVKKLRDLEKGKLLPDNELLWVLYDLYYIPPAVVLKDPKGLANELSVLLASLDGRYSRMLYQYIRLLREL